jgi:tetratricopeptide (TPR) repeat protein
MKTKTPWLPSLILMLAVGLAAGCYWPGLQGGFLFDDFHNLEDLGAYGGVRDWETFRAFVFGGDSGPTGRPLALLSFLLDDNAWPSYPAWFKSTNLAIHLLCGLFLCWCGLLLLRSHEFEERTAQWIAVFSAACWLLHPLMVSTTLYVVQRMAQLAALFVFAGIAGYLYGRALLPMRPRAAYVWMTVSLGLGTILATLCKENGALLPLLLLVVEYCLPCTPSKPRPAGAWRAVCLLLPSLALLAYFARQIDFSPDLWPNRPFDQPERLWSEARILWEYLHLLFIPEIEGRGLFQDGFAISKGWLTPWTTLPAAIGLAALLGAALLIRRRWPLVALAVLFFFAGHVMESGVIGLELYFEHRNYLSAAFLFLPLGQGLKFLAERKRPALALIAGGLIVCLFAGLTLQRARLWQDTDRLTAYWAASNPDSARAQNAAASIMVERGRIEEANAHLKAAIERLPDSALLNLRLLLQKIHAHEATGRDFQETSRRLVRQPFDAQAVVAIRTIVDHVIRPEAPAFYREATLELLDTMDRNAAFSRFSVYDRLSPYLKGRLFLAQSEMDEACRQYGRAASLYNDVEAALMMVAEIASARGFDCASTVLALAQENLERQSDRSLRRPRQSYEFEIKRLREIIDEEKRK